METSIPLVHSWDNQPVQAASGLFTLGNGVEIPARWQPQVADIDAPAIPTPFARAEAVRLVLARADEGTNHDLLRDFKWLLLGLAAGVLRLEPADLVNEEYGNLGRALLQVDPDARYFCRVLWPDRALAFGATYRSCLMWGHARRTKEDWDRLAAAVQPRHAQALTLLSEWREVLRRMGRWAPGRLAWQRGFDSVVGAAEPRRDLKTLRDDATLVGPVMLELPPDRGDDALRIEPIYLPSYSPGFATRLVNLCKHQPQVAKAAIEFPDARGVIIGRLRLPASGKDLDVLALGSGLAEVPSADSPQAPTGTQKLWVQGPGGVAELLKPVQLALEALSRPVTKAAINTMEVSYPDPVRILVQRGLWPGMSAQSAYTSRATLLLASGGQVLPEAQDAESSGGVQVTLESGTNVARLILVDRLGDVDVLDLRALGYVLFRVFVREAGALPELGGNLGDETTFEALMVNTMESSLEPAMRVYEAVAVPPSEGLRRRLAAMQRFVKTYETAAPGVDRVLDRASKSFARWASGLPEVKPLGRKGTRTVVYRLAIGVELKLAQDAIGSG